MRGGVFFATSRHSTDPLTFGIRLFWWCRIAAMSGHETDKVVHISWCISDHRMIIICIPDCALLCKSSFATWRLMISGVEYFRLQSFGSRNLQFSCKIWCIALQIVGPCSHWLKDSSSKWCQRWPHYQLSWLKIGWLIKHLRLCELPP